MFGRARRLYYRRREHKIHGLGLSRQRVESQRNGPMWRIHPRSSRRYCGSGYKTRGAEDLSTCAVRPGGGIPPNANAGTLSQADARANTGGYVPFLAIVLSLLPRQGEAPLSQAPRSLLPSPCRCRLGLRATHFRGHFCVHVRYGPMPRHHPVDDAVGAPGGSAGVLSMTCVPGVKGRRGIVSPQICPIRSFLNSATVQPVPATRATDIQSAHPAAHAPPAWGESMPCIRPRHPARSGKPPRSTPLPADSHSASA